MQFYRLVSNESRIFVPIYNLKQWNAANVRTWMDNHRCVSNDQASNSYFHESPRVKSNLIYFLQEQIDKLGRFYSLQSPVIDSNHDPINFSTVFLFYVKYRRSACSITLLIPITKFVTVYVPGEHVSLSVQVYLASEFEQIFVYSNSAKLRG